MVKCQSCHSPWDWTQACFAVTRQEIFIHIHPINHCWWILTFISSCWCYFPSTHLESNDIPHQQRLYGWRYLAAALFFQAAGLTRGSTVHWTCLGFATGEGPRGFDDSEAHLSQRTCWEIWEKNTASKQHRQSYEYWRVLPSGNLT